MISDVSVKFKGPGVDVEMVFRWPVFSEDIAKSIFPISLAAYILRKQNITIDDIKTVFKKLSHTEKKILLGLRNQMVVKIRDEKQNSITFRLDKDYQGRSFTIPILHPLPHLLPLYIE